MAPERSYRWLFWSLVVAGLLLDQSSKYYVFHWLYNETGSGQCDVVPGAFKLLAQFTGEREEAVGLMSRLRTVSAPMLPRVNQGALFGIKLGLGHDDVWFANLVFAIVSVVAAAAITTWSTRRATARDGLLCAALGLILGGTLGNLYDRLVFHGVRDFLYFHWIEWPVFNVADCCLVCGAFCLLAQAFLTRPAGDATPRAEVALATAPAEAR
jgi:lipoprotein signal peptidase